jgi:ribosomal protein S18 acetylase RimI-like enzyme
VSDVPVTYRVRQAGPEICDWDDLVNLRLSVQRRLRELGVGQWQDTAAGLAQLARYFDHGEVRMVVAPDGTLAGAFVLTRRWERALWSDDDDRGQFLYLHKVMTAPVFRGNGLGRQVVRLAMTTAGNAGLAGVRLNCYHDNPELRALWEARGFTYLRTVPGVTSGTLMEQRVPVRAELPQ